MTERDLFVAAIEYHDRTERAAFLDRACAGDTTLRERVERLLSTHDSAGDFLERPPALDFVTAGPSAPPSTVREMPKPKHPPTADPDPYPTQVPEPAEATPPSAPAAGPSRYRPLRPLKRGGLGEVWVALDEELQREIALKQIQGDYAADADSRGRFLLEAEVTGRLEHPGVVPVYGLGVAPDGKPYYAMRLIKGETFTDAIKRFHDADLPGRDPGERSLALRELLARFVAVCNAVAYAHSKGVLHRDLKPDNVMLGAFGETLVIDWGLAKVLGRTADDSPLGSVFRSAATEQLEKTGIAGTPPYMSPEQATGAAESLGAATDVYSLGAILYMLLTGQQAFRGSVSAVLEQVRWGHFAPPRKVKASAPRALEAVCLKAMARLPEERYASARELAADVERWLADEPTTAWREPLTERARRWARRHRTLMACLGVLLLTATAGLAVGLGLVNAEKNRTKIAEENTRKALEQVTAEQGKTQAALEKSRAAEAKAREQTQLALDTVKSVVTDIHEQLKDRPALQELRKKLLNTAEEGLKRVARSAETAAQIDHATVWVHIELGDIFLFLDGAAEEARKQYQLAAERARQLADGDEGDAQAQRDLAAGLSRLGTVQLRLGDTRAALDNYRRSLGIFRKLGDAGGGDAPAQRDLYLSHMKVGDVLLQQGDTKGALDEYRASLGITRKLAAANPRDGQAQRDVATAHEKVGDALLRQGDERAALDEYRASLGIARKLAEVNPRHAKVQRDLSVAHEKVGDVLLRQGDTDGALDEYRASLDIARALADADPHDARARRDLSVAQSKMGDVLLRRDDTDGAREAYRAAFDITRALADADPRDVQAQRDLAASHERMGDVLIKQGDTKAAQEAYRAGFDIRRKLAAADPHDAEVQWEYFVSCTKMGGLDQAAFRYADAADYFKKGRDALEPLRKAGQLTAEQQRWLPLTDEKIAFCEAAEKALADLDFALKQSESLVPRLLEARARYWHKNGKHAEVSATADKFRTLADVPGGLPGYNLYNAACGYALASTCADADEKMKEAHAAKAVALLKEARDKGCFKAKETVEHAKKDADLDALRQRDDFKALLAELEKDGG
jgi:tetratricopeptide (TPR) repeat protein/tRNA A-37 threonylcarbamoyl transferase component Bud32